MVLHYENISHKVFSLDNLTIIIINLDSGGSEKGRAIRP